MNVKEPKERIFISLLTSAACLAIILIVALIVTPQQWLVKVYLLQQGLLVSTIEFLGVIAAGLIAALALVFINRRIQTYSWRRDQALKDIETIYEPLYKDINEVVTATETLNDFHWQSTNWNSINNSYLATKLNLMEKQLHQGLKDLFDDLSGYSYRRWAAITMVRGIAKTIIETHLDENMPTETRELILKDMPTTLDYEAYVYRGFLVGKSVREWSSLNFRGEDEYLITQSHNKIKGKSYCQHQEFTFEQIEAILDEICQKVQDEVEFRQFLDWCKALNGRAAHLKKELEERILKPQLP